MFTLRIDAEAIDPAAFARVEEALSAVPQLPPGVNPNLLPKDQQKALVRAELLRKQRARGRQAVTRGG